MTTTMKYTRKPCAYITGCPAHCSLAWADTITVTQQDRHGVEFPCNATAYSTACVFRLTTQKLSNICIADVLAGESTGDLFLQSSNSESVLYVRTTQFLFYYFLFISSTGHAWNRGRGLSQSSIRGGWKWDHPRVLAETNTRGTNSPSQQRQNSSGSYRRD